MTDNGDTVTVRSLLCHSHVEMGITCYKELLKHCRDRIKLCIHDDGSLTEDDVDRLRNAGAEIVRRRDVDAVMEEYLKDYPAAASFRRESPMGVKLFDIPYLAQDVVSYVDSDVLFMRPFSNVFSLPSGADAVFMKDVRSAYSFSDVDALRTDRVRLPEKINTGVFVMRKSVYDLDRVEWFLSQSRYATKPVWREQTAYAMLGLGNFRLYDPGQIITITPKSRHSSRIVAAHFVTSVRHMLKPWAETARQEATQDACREVVKIETVEVKIYDRMGAIHDISNRVVKRIADNTPVLPAS